MDLTALSTFLKSHDSKQEIQEKKAVISESSYVIESIPHDLTPTFSSLLLPPLSPLTMAEKKQKGSMTLG